MSEGGYPTTLIFSSLTNADNRFYKMKILNIDAFSDPKREVTLGGVTYPVQEISVQEFIDNLKASESLEKEGSTLTLVESFEEGVKAIKQAVPTMPEATIRSLKLAAMTAVLRFVRGELDPDVEEPEAEAGAEEKKQD